MNFTWKDSYFEKTIYDNDKNVIGFYRSSGSKQTQIGNNIFYTELDGDMNTLIIMQDEKFKQIFCTYHQNGFFVFENYNLEYVSSNNPHLQIGYKILIHYWKDSGFFKRTGSITIIDMKDQWEMLIYCLLFAINMGEISSTIA